MTTLLSTQASPPSSAESRTTDHLIALVGNPNTGKTSVFNMLTGARHRVANYPGVTVDKVTGRIQSAKLSLEVVDLPGTYSLAARSPDEMIVTDTLLGRQEGTGKVSAVIVVADAANLDRNLFLATQVIETGVPTVIALNMIDVANRNGICIDVAQLSKRLGVPVAPLQARKGIGRRELIEAVEKVIGEPQAAVRLDWPASVEAATEAFGAALARLSRDDRPPAPYEVRRCLLDVDGYCEQRLSKRYNGELLTELHTQRATIEGGGAALPSLEAELRYRWIQTITDACVRWERSDRKRVSERVDDVLTHRVAGSFIFILVMGAIFVSVFAWAAPLMDAVDGAFGWLGDLIHGSLGEGVLASFLADGLVAGVGGVLIFLPQILILFALITILEDCGYLARAAFLMDRLFRACGLGGRSFVPMLSSFACAIPGVMSARTIENRRERLVTILVAPLMSCSARIPIYTILVAAFVPSVMVAGFLPLQGLVFASLYFFGIAVAAVVALIFSRLLFKGEESPFILELPSYKVPSAKTVVLRLWDRGKDFVLTAGTIILAMSVVIWALTYFPRPPTLEQQVRSQVIAQGVTDEDEIQKAVDGAYLRQSVLGRIGHAIEPAVRPLGWDWKIGTAAVAAFPAREVVISTLGIIYNLGPDESEESEVLRDKLRAATWPDGRKVFTLPVALSIMVFFALCCQCQATVAVIQRETRSWRWPVVVFSYMTGLAYVCALVVYQVGTLIMGT